MHLPAINDLVKCWPITIYDPRYILGCSNFNSMKDIQELVYIIQQHHLVLMNTNGQPLDRETLLYRFFEGIEKRAITSDEEAKKFLYPEGEAVENTGV